ncbi:hypothetical protein EA473_20390 [Natrarchaeobius chitinivorans]|uniref:Uncharacterized protein n=1 Tax=Natrarchaeobius chitinivorans TaxID=1679083 RepID=A0A3N6P017_NATCH|nr:hypothetical protein EA473_20390 [Natrarchaeobius chitinivorans]
MPEQLSLRSDGGFTPRRVAVLIGALVGFAVTWALFVVAPPDGSVSPFAMGISFLAGAYLLVLVYSYLKQPSTRSS